LEFGVSVGDGPIGFRSSSPLSQTSLQTCGYNHLQGRISMAKDRSPKKEVKKPKKNKK
jgi:hypothetical protein